MPPTVETRSDALGCEVPRRDVGQDLLERTERTVRLASRSLGLDPAPRVRWLPKDVKGIRGIVFDDALGEIWVRMQTPDETKDTALHELRHVYQLKGARYRTLGLLTHAQRQRDADQFAANWTWEQTPVSAPKRAVDQEAGRRRWERKWRPLHQAVADHYATLAARRRRRR